MVGKLFAIALLVILVAYIYQISWGSSSSSREGLIVETSYGILKGLTSVSRDGNEFYEWLNIPYAKSPVGKLRFKSPQPADKWTDVREATAYGHECPQLDMMFEKFKGSEDCLSLNVFVPKNCLEEKKLLAVVVWIHGGYFSTGSSKMYRPDYFMDESILVVTVNYRLGALGFLNMADKDGLIRGNMGLKDQAMALKWIKSEITNFGGDPNQLILMGESAGGASTHYHMLSPMSKDLISKVISQSGVAINSWSLNENPREQAQELARRLSCPIENGKEMEACLQNADVVDIVGKFRPALANLLQVFGKKSQIFVPTIETKIDQETFLSQHPIELIKSKKFAKVPFLLGMNSEEALMATYNFLANETVREYIDKNWTELTESLLQFSPKQKSAYAQKVRDFYFGKESINNLEAFYPLTHAISDRFFKVDITKAAILHAEQGPVYFYYYQKQGPTFFDLLLNMQGSSMKILTNFVVSWFKTKILKIDPPYYGVGHADELGMFFQIQGKLFHIGPDDDNYQFSKDLIKLWLAFITDDTTMKFRNAAFPKLNIKDGLNYFEIDEPASYKSANEQLQDSYKFWNSLEKL